MLLSKLCLSISSISCLSSSNFLVKSIGSFSRFSSYTMVLPLISMYGFIFWIMRTSVFGSRLKILYMRLSSSSLACWNIYVQPVSFSTTDSAFLVISISSTILTIFPFVSAYSQKSALSSSCLRALAVSLRYSGQLRPEFQKLAWFSK